MLDEIIYLALREHGRTAMRMQACLDTVVLRNSSHLHECIDVRIDELRIIRAEERFILPDIALKIELFRTAVLQQAASLVSEIEPFVQCFLSSVIIISIILHFKIALLLKGH